MNVAFVAAFTEQQAPHGYGLVMNSAKQHRKLEKLQLNAEVRCTSTEAQKILKRADNVLI